MLQTPDGHDNHTKLKQELLKSVQHPVSNSAMKFELLDSGLNNTQIDQNFETSNTSSPNEEYTLMALYIIFKV